MRFRPRLPDWEARLHDYVMAHAATPFEWGVHDCALFSAGAAAAMTGTDCAAEFRGQYRDAKGAAKALRTFGAGTLRATFDRHFEPIPVAFAGRGDLAMTGDGNIGVVIGDAALFAGEEDGAPGLVRLRLADCVTAWRV